MGPDWPLLGREREVALANRLGDPSWRGILLTGPPGVGKTRVAEHLLDAARQAGLPTARVAGLAHAQAVPLAAVAHLLPADVADFGPGNPDVSAAAMFLRAQAALRAAAGDRRLVLLIDDADLVDGFSQALVASLVHAGVAVVLATMRAGHHAEAIEQLVRQGALVGRQLGPLVPPLVRELVESVLDGPVEPAVVTALRDASIGNPLVLRELLDHALSTGAITDTDGTWRLVGHLGMSTRLVDLVQERLAGCTEAERQVMTFLAVAAELPTAVVASLTIDDAVESLLARGLVQERRDGRRAWLRAGHPIYGEVLRSVTTGRRLAAASGALADAVEALGLRRRDDLLNVVQWRLDAGRTPSVDGLVQAARIALAAGDAPLADKLMRALPAAEDSIDAERMRAELAFAQGRIDEVERRCAALLARPLDEPTRVAVTRRRAQNLFFGFGDPRCITVGDDALELLTTFELRDAVVAHQATMLVLSGLPRRALELAEPLLDSENPRTRVEAAMSVSLAQVVLGWGASVLEIVDPALDQVRELGPMLGMLGPGSLVFNRVLALSGLGRQDEAVDAGQQALDRRRSDSGPSSRSSVLLAMVRTLLLAGRFTEAIDRALAEARLSERAGLAAQERWALGLAAMGLDVLGRTGEAGPMLERVRALEIAMPNRGLFHVDIDRAHGWHLAATGELAAARTHLLDVADRCARRDLVVGAVSALFDHARFGDAPTARDRLATLDLAGDQPLMQAMVAGIAAAADDDHAALADAAEGFERVGTPLAAAEWWALAARAASRSGDVRRRNAARTAAAAAQALVPDAVTPIISVAAADASGLLTGREQEVALLASRGLSSKDIASRLDLSIRTVDTHLQRAYTKLGIRSRSELAPALEPNRQPQSP